MSHRDPEASEPHNLFGESEQGTKLNSEQIKRYEAMYGRKWRALYRWIEEGEKAGDPTPLHDPQAMVKWWNRNKTWRIPSEIEAAAIAAARGSDASPSPAATPDPPAPNSQPPPDPTVKASAAAGRKIDLESIDPEEGDRLRELKQIQAAKFAELKERLRLGDDCSVLEGKYLKLSETVDKIETRVTERAKKRGLYVLRDEVERDLAANAELLRQSTEAMERRVLELCPSLSEEQRKEVRNAITKARSAEARMFARLPSLSAHDVLRELHEFAA